MINFEYINKLLENSGKTNGREPGDILKNGQIGKGISLEEAAILINNNGPNFLDNLFNTAAEVKKKIFGNRLVFFAPLYISSFCVNDCLYCGFHLSNKLPRKKLTLEEIKKQTLYYLEMGHKRILLEAGEDEENNPIDFILQAIETIYSVKKNGGNIRRINVNIAATTVDNYRLLKQAQIGTYQLFQETYHLPTYQKIHRGPKSDYNRQFYALDRAFAGGLDDLGMGVLLGLYDWRFEVLALLSHVNYLKNNFGIGPHTISIPRIKKAPSVGLEQFNHISDDDLYKIIAIFRVAVPYAGIIISTRESPETRKRAYEIGVSQSSAASITSPGGHISGQKETIKQFELSDKRSLDEVILSMMKEGFVPSFCTACYRKNRTGENFIHAAVDGSIHQFCESNSILTLQEYLLDYASKESQEIGKIIINKEMKNIKNNQLKKMIREKMERIIKGERDLFF